MVNEQRGYAIDRQGKALDWVLEVASSSTGVVDYTAERQAYERYGIPKYWRFDPSGSEYLDAALAGDRLTEDGYEPIAVEILGEGNLRGGSEALGLYVCGESGKLRFYNPITEDYLPDHEQEHAGRLSFELSVSALVGLKSAQAARRPNHTPRSSRPNFTDCAVNRVFREVPESHSKPSRTFCTL